MLGSVLPFFFPNACVVCNKPVERKRYVCRSCESDLYYIGRNSRCKTCLTPVPEGETICGGCIVHPPHFEALVSCVFFRGAVRTSLHRYKFRNRPDLHSSFSRMLIDRLFDAGCTDFDVVVPIPLSKERFAERGYNQSALIAKDVASHYGAIYNKEAIFRNRDTLRQSDLAHAYRAGNVRGAFSPRNLEGLSGKHVLLVDDIFTTGATLQEASRVLAKSGCRITACTISAAIASSND